MSQEESIQDQLTRLAMVRGTPRAAPPQFAEVRRLFGRLRTKHQKKGSELRLLLGEADHRLGQLDFIVQRVWLLERDHTRQTRRADDAVEIMVLCEAFYYFASRFRNILRDHCPGFERFEIGAARDVRHHLIEHPEKHGQAINFNYLIGLGDRGPVIKPFGPRSAGRNNKTTADEGLYVNADELIKRTVDALNRALNAGGA